MLLQVLGCILASYFLGSLASAVIVCRLLGLSDPRCHGSGNPGATNVLRIHGKFPALITLLSDWSKGFIPVLIVKNCNFDLFTMSLVAVCAFLGHLYPVFFKFRGGKGVATFFGAMFGLNWLLGVTLTMIWLLVAWKSHYSSVAAITMSILAPFLVWCFLLSSPSALLVATMSGLLLMRHRNNILNLWRKQEPMLRFK